MSKLFGNLTSTDQMEKQEDRLGGGYSAKETDIYTGQIKLAYAGESSGGARSITLVLSGGDFGDSEYRETIYITSSKAKGQNNYYMVKDGEGKETGKKKALPGFEMINDLCLVTEGSPLEEQDAEEKVVKIYSYEARKEEPQKVMVLTGLLGQTASFAITKTIENKSEKKGDEYVPIADTREVNTIAKVFHTESKMTVVEAQEGATEPTFWGSWLEKNKGKVIDKTNANVGSSNKGSGGRASSGSNEPPASSNTQRKSLFGG